MNLETGVAAVSNPAYRFSRMHVTCVHESEDGKRGLTLPTMCASFGHPSPRFLRSCTASAAVCPTVVSAWVIPAIELMGLNASVSKPGPTESGAEAHLFSGPSEQERAAPCARLRAQTRQTEKESGRRVNRWSSGPNSYAFDLIFPQQ